MSAVIRTFAGACCAAILFAVCQVDYAAGQEKASSGLPVESVTVIGTKPSETTIKAFVEARSTKTRVVGQIAKWRRPICPITVGLGAKYATYITQRIRDVAKTVGAPIEASPSCKPNIEVVFTTVPQTFMDKLRQTGPGFLGYYDTTSQADELAKVTHPIQGWYTTESVDYDGAGSIDTGRCGTGLNMQVLETVGGGGGENSGVQVVVTMNMPCAVSMHSAGSRLGNGFSSGFHNVLIVAEPAKLLNYEIGALADYVVMMALSQPSSLDTCQELPSISNMLAKDCSSVPSRITDGDLAYLRGLYAVPDGYSAPRQRESLSYEMAKTLITDKSK